MPEALAKVAGGTGDGNRERKKNKSKVWLETETDTAQKGNFIRSKLLPGAGSNLERGGAPGLLRQLRDPPPM